MANREQLEELANTIKESIDSSIKSAFQSVVIPADADTLVQDISQSFETKNMSSLGTAIEKTNTFIEKVGFNLEKFGKGINETFKKYLEQKTVAEKEVEVMREENILGQTELIENEIRATTISNKELNERKEIIQREEEQLKLKEETLNPQELVSLQEDTEYNKDREKLQKEKKSIQQTEQQNNAELGNALGKTGGGFHRLPEFLQGPVDMFTQALMLPVNMVKEIIGAFKNFGKAIIQTTKFIIGNFFVALKKVAQGFRRMLRGMRNFIRGGIRMAGSGLAALANPMVLLGGAIAGIVAIIPGGIGLIKKLFGVMGDAVKKLTGGFDKLLVRFLFGEEGVKAMESDKGRKEVIAKREVEEAEKDLKEKKKIVEEVVAIKKGLPFHKKVLQSLPGVNVTAQAKIEANEAAFKLQQAKKRLKNIEEENKILEEHEKEKKVKRNIEPVKEEKESLWQKIKDLFEKGTSAGAARNITAVDARKNTVMQSSVNQNAVVVQPTEVNNRETSHNQAQSGGY